ncbi:MAG: Rrf2 family transcriptional regulator [Phycisphaerae bacterium]
MLALTKKTEYALIALCHLARESGQIVSARDIATRYSVRLPLMMNVMKTLNQRGLLRSIRGANGGYQLAAAADRVSLADLFEAVEGPARLVHCAPPVEKSDRHCELVGCCPVRAPLHGIHRKLQSFLGETTVADVAFDAGFGRPDVPDSSLRVLAR